MMVKRNRNIMIPFRVTAAEKEQIRQKMRQAGTDNMEGYLRKMALNGYILKLDLQEIKQMNSLMLRMSDNLNQLTRRVNATGRIYKDDLDDIQRQQAALWSSVRSILIRLEQLD